MDGIQIDKRSTLPESSKRNEEKKGYCGWWGERTKGERRKEKTRRNLFVFSKRERDRARELASTLKRDSYILGIVLKFGPV